MTAVDVGRLFSNFDWKSFPVVDHAKFCLHSTEGEALKNEDEEISHAIIKHFFFVIFVALALENVFYGQEGSKSPICYASCYILPIGDDFHFFVCV